MTKQKRSILVTGGAGYIGSVLVPNLLDGRYNVTVVDNLYYDQTSLLHHSHKENFEFVKGDVRDEEIIGEAIEGKDVIIPLAAMVGAPLCKENPRYAESTNLEAIRLLDDLREDGQRIIFPTTNSGYGTTSGETYCTEETPLEPISLYGRTKVQAEEELLSSGDAITLRLATVFGVSPRMRVDLLVNNFVYEAVNRGYIIVYEKDFKRNYVNIRDVADCIEYCIENFEDMKNEPYNVGLDEANLSKEELAEEIKKQIPDFYVHYQEIHSDPDKRNYIVSNEKIKSKGFEPNRSIEEGIEELRKAYSMMPLGKFRNY